MAGLGSVRWKWGSKASPRRPEFNGSKQFPGVMENSQTGKRRKAYLQKRISQTQASQ